MYRQLFELAGISIILCTEDGVVIDCNQAALELFACTREQMIGTSAIDWATEFQPNGRRSTEMAAEMLAQIARDGKATFEWLNVRHDGSEMLVDITVNQMHLDGRTVLICVSRDISKIKRAEDALKASEEKFRAIFHHLPMSGMIYQLIRDAQGEVVDWTVQEANEFGAHDLETTPAALIGKHAKELFGEDIMQPYIALCREVVSSQQPLYLERRIQE